jgi:hypothetical protein
MRDLAIIFGCREYEAIKSILEFTHVKHYATLLLTNHLESILYEEALQGGQATEGNFSST